MEQCPGIQVVYNLQYLPSTRNGQDKELAKHNHVKRARYGRIRLEIILGEAEIP